jgi:hypothetical protein
MGDDRPVEVPPGLGGITADDETDEGEGHRGHEGKKRESVSTGY